MKEKSYSELMKASVMNRKHLKESFVLDLYIDMLISEIRLTNQREKLLKRIDKAIDERDRKTFLTLSAQLNELNKLFGT